MPTYEYVCKSCRAHYEIFQSITAKPLQKCPQCKRRQLRRLIGKGAGIIFKGSGFYETDYKHASTKPEKKEKAETVGEGPVKKEGKKEREGKGTPVVSGKKSE